jgi:hypothetical protein
MVKQKAVYVSADQRPPQIEEPVVDAWPQGDGKERDFQEAQRRHHLMKTISAMGEYARNEGYPLASLLLFDVVDQIGLLLFVDYQKKHKL